MSEQPENEPTPDVELEPVEADPNAPPESPEEEMAAMAGDDPFVGPDDDGDVEAE